MINITYDSFNIGNAEFKSLKAERCAGFYRLTVEVGLNLNPNEKFGKITITNLMADISVYDKNKNVPVGRMSLMDGCFEIEIFESRLDRTIRFFKDLDSVRVSTLESIRNGNGLIFDISMMGLIFSEKNNLRSNFVANLHVDVNQSRWIEILNEMEYKKIILLEIPFPGNEKSDFLRPAVKFLEDARKQLLLGHFEESIMNSRRALEFIIENADVDAETSEENNNKKLTKSQRIDKIRKAVIRYIHPSAHADENAMSIKWTPEDARSVLIFVSTLYRLAVDENDGRVNL